MEPELHYAILKTLSYFQVFQYPLTRDEIWKFLPVKSDITEVAEALEQLQASGTIFQFEQYYCLHNEPYLITRRKAGNELGRKKLKKAERIAKSLGAFPFVEAVCISGSLSKDFALKDSDLDFFIITAPGRLWIARNLMHLFRKMTFVVNAQDSFCMNYYISLQQPEILPKNFYTAIELCTLKAACVHDGINDLILANWKWISVELPNISMTRNLPYEQSKKWLGAKLLESAINKMGGDKVESFFYKTTMKRWERKWSRQNYDLYKCMLSAGPHFNTPVNYPVHLPEEILQKCEKIMTAASLKYKLQHSTQARAIRA
jgi:hypothetical protein